jgi:hypothetical protein
MEENEFVRWAAERRESETRKRTNGMVMMIIMIMISDDHQIMMIMMIIMMIMMMVMIMMAMMIMMTIMIMIMMITIITIILIVMIMMAMMIMFKNESYHVSNFKHLAIPFNAVKCPPRSLTVFLGELCTFYCAFEIGKFHLENNDTKHTQRYIEYIRNFIQTIG